MQCLERPLGERALADARLVVLEGPAGLGRPEDIAADRFVGRLDAGAGPER